MQISTKKRRKEELATRKDHQPDLSSRVICNLIRLRGKNLSEEKGGERLATPR